MIRLKYGTYRGLEVWSLSNRGTAMKKERKELLTLWITLSLQLGTYAAQ